MMRSSTRPPGSTLTTSGSPSVRSLARNASYFTSFKSGLAAAPPMVMPGAFALSTFPFTFAGADADGDAPVMAPGDMLPPFLSSENLVGRRKAEIGQHHDHFLLVRLVALIADDQRCRHQ